MAAGGICQISAIGMKKTGAPIWDGTEIMFTTTAGRIDPVKATFQDGRATAQFFAPKSSGTATISAISGTVDIKGVDIDIGIPVESLVISANPMSFPAGGGKSSLRVVAYDEHNSPVPQASIIFICSNGTLASGGNSMLTNANGIAKDTLTTDKDADVYAYSGKVKSDTLTVQVDDTPDTPPTAKFSWSPASPAVGATIYFNASQSTDEDGQIVRWEWDFGDGSTGTGERTTYAYHTAASYHVVLCVVDNDGLKGYAEDDIEVGSNLTTLILTANPMSLPAGGGHTTLQAIAYDDQNMPVAHVSVIFWASSGTLSSSGAPVQTNSEGLARDTLKTDVDTEVYAYAGSIQSQTLTIKVDTTPDAPPKAVFVWSPTSPTVSTTVYFNGTQSTDEDGQIVRWDWDFGDGWTGAGDRTSHAYSTAATYTVVLCVTDNDGLQGCTSNEVTISNPARSHLNRRNMGE